MRLVLLLAAAVILVRDPTSKWANDPLQPWFQSTQGATIPTGTQGMRQAPTGYHAACRGLLPLEHSECKNAWQALNRPCLHGILPKGLPCGETISLGGNGGFGVPEAVQRGRPLHFLSRCSARMRRGGLRRTLLNCRLIWQRLLCPHSPFTLRGLSVCRRSCLSPPFWDAETH